MANPEDADAHLSGEVLTIKTVFCPLNTKRSDSVSGDNQGDGQVSPLQISFEDADDGRPAAPSYLHR
jgi:hypothetical protein